MGKDDVYIGLDAPESYTAVPVSVETGGPRTVDGDQIFTSCLMPGVLPRVEKGGILRRSGVLRRARWDSSV
jgi:hypothetical protein